MELISINRTEEARVPEYQPFTLALSRKTDKVYAEAAKINQLRSTSIMEAVIAGIVNEYQYVPDYTIEKEKWFQTLLQDSRQQKRETEKCMRRFVSLYQIDTDFFMRHFILTDLLIPNASVPVIQNASLHTHLTNEEVMLACLPQTTEALNRFFDRKKWLKL